MALRFKVQLVMIAEDGEETAHELVVLNASRIFRRHGAVGVDR
jgi:hypothetical protein